MRTALTCFTVLYILNCSCLEANSIVPRERRAFRAAEDVRFHLFTTENGTSGEQLQSGEIFKLRASTFNASNPTRFLIHGWYGDFASGINLRLRDAFHQHPTAFNVFVVDWSPISQNANYASVRGRAPLIGRAIGEFIDFLHQHGSLAYNSTQLIGHSLGAHVAGFAGKHITGSGNRLAAIVGLDPARPLFDIAKPTERLAATDAQYVETIHTNRGLKGFSRPIGHSAFYPNWGALQLGCGRDVAGSCSHTRAVLFFQESVSRREGRWFRGTRCANAYEEIKRKQCTAVGWVEMGGEPLLAVGSDKATVGGVYFLPTRDSTPFGMALD